jgi:hypothetical protein
MRAKYRLPGMLNGCELGFDMVYNSGWVRDYYRPASSTNPERLYEWIGGKTLWGGFIQYRWKTGKKHGHVINLGSRNIFDKLHTGLGSTRSMGRQVYLSYTYTFR